MQNKKSEEVFDLSITGTISAFQTLINANFDTKGVIKRLKKEESKLEKQLNKYLNLFTSNKIVYDSNLLEEIHHKLNDLVDRTCRNTHDRIFVRSDVI